MCNQCDDSSHPQAESTTQALPRRQFIAAGVGLAAAPLLAAMPGSASAQAAGSTSASAVTGALGSVPFETGALGVTRAGQPLRPLKIQRRAVGPRDVLVDILYAGVCHSDIHTANGDWGGPDLPCVPGHEIIGRVIAVGRQVTKFRVGEIAGVGCMVDSCGVCENCLSDREQICTQGTTFTYAAPDKVSGGHTMGGYSEQIVVSERFAIRIPPGMDLASAAPILCAGITTFSPIRHWNVTPGQRVAVAGLGGLGHMAVKLAAAQRADVTVLTTTPSKVADARRLGAKDAVIWTDTNAMRKLANTFDLIISTIPYGFEVSPLIDTLRLEGTLVNVGLGEAKGLNTFAMALGRKRLSGSMIGGVAETQEVIDYCFARNIRPDVEMIKPGEINQAFTRVVNKDVRYRFVIDFASAKSAA